MRAWIIDSTFGLDHLRLVERDARVVGPGQVRVRLRAASLNYRDLLMVKGLYNPRQPLPLVPCSDGVGEVVEVGAGVERVAVGARVCTLFAQGWLAGEPTRERIRWTLGGPLDGTLADEIVLAEDGVIPAPPHLSDEEAATLPCAALTAWSALVTYGHVKAGDWVLTEGTGGVSLFALLFAKALGARVIATSSREDKLERLEQLGADAVISYVDAPRWGRIARELTGGEGVDHVVDVGGAATLGEATDAVRPGGTISIIGVLGGATPPLNILPILMRNVRMQGIIVGHRDGFLAMNRAIEAHHLRAPVDRIFAFAEARSAFEHVESSQHFGKVVIALQT